MRAILPLLMVILGVFYMGTQKSYAQVPTIQDCLGAIVVCQEVYFEENAPSGQGNYPNEINASISCMANENNSTWYTFTVNQTGNFGFELIPNDPNTDYDWSLFNITDDPCEDISSNEALITSCNAAGGGDCQGLTGANGDTSYDIQGAGCNNFPPNIFSAFTPLNDVVQVQAGNTYVLVVSNWSGNQSGYTLDFGITDVGIFDFTPPTVDGYIDPDPCNGLFLLIDFSENILCASIDQANFSLTGPNGVQNINVVSALCDVGAQYTRNITVVFDPRLETSGSYTLDFCCLTDACGNEISPQQHTFEYIYDSRPILDLGEDTMICDHVPLTFDLSSVDGDITWQDGTTEETFTIIESGTVTVSAVNDCGTTTDEINVIFSDFPVVDLGSDSILCSGDIVLLDATEPGSTYEWQDGTVNASFLVQIGGEYSVTVTNECGVDIDTISFNPIPDIVVDLPDNGYLCQESILVQFNDSEFFDIQWQDGSNANEYLIEQEGIYTLVVDSPCGLYEDSFEIYACEEEIIFVPNVFSPVAPGENQLFKLFSTNPITSFEMLVYDRWGNNVYTSDSWEDHGWDGSFNGRDALAGVYVYVVQYSLTINGEPGTRSLYGDVSLVR